MGGDSDAAGSKMETKGCQIDEVVWGGVKCKASARGIGEEGEMEQGKGGGEGLGVGCDGRWVEGGERNRVTRVVVWFWCVKSISTSSSNVGVGPLPSTLCIKDESGKALKGQPTVFHLQAITPVLNKQRSPIPVGCSNCCLNASIFLEEFNTLHNEHST